MNARLFLPRPPPSDEARRKRKLAIAAALNESSPQTSEKNLPTNAISDTSRSQEGTAEGLFNATNLPPVPIAQPFILRNEHIVLDEASPDVSSPSVDIFTASPIKATPETTVASNADIGEESHAPNNEAVDSRASTQSQHSGFGSAAHFNPQTPHPQPNKNEPSIEECNDLPESHISLGSQAVPEIGFVSARQKPLVVSAEALEKAQELFATIEAETTDTDTETLLSRPSPRPSSRSGHLRLPFKSPLTPAKAKEVSLKAKMNAMVGGSTYQSSPLNPNRIGGPRETQGLATPIRKSTIPVSASGPSGSSTPFSGSPAASSTPVLHGRSGGGIQQRSGKPTQRGFNTPYKPGFRPGENGRTDMEVLYRPFPKVVPSLAPASSAKGKGKQRAGLLHSNACFDLSAVKFYLIAMECVDLFRNVQILLRTGWAYASLELSRVCSI